MFGILALLTAVFPGQMPVRPVFDVKTLPAELQGKRMLAVFSGRNDEQIPLNMVTRGTAPVRAGDFQPDRQSLLLWDPLKREIIHAQTEVVARRGDGSTEVVEAIFPATLPELGVVDLAAFVSDAPPDRPEPTRLPGLDFRADPGLLTVRANDALGNAYSCKLFEKHMGTIKQGVVESVEEYFAVLRPDQPNAKTFPQLFRFHVFVASSPLEPLLRVQVLVENNATQAPASDFYFDRLEIGGKNLSLVWHDAAPSEERPMQANDGFVWTEAIPRQPDGKLNVGLDYFLTFFEFVLSRPDDAAKAKLAARGRPLFIAAPGLDVDGGETRSWNSTPAFGPSRVGIPLSPSPPRALLRQLDAVFQAFTAKPPEWAQAGPFAIHGDTAGDAPGGNEIAFTNPTAVRFIQAGGHVETWLVLRSLLKATLHRQRFGLWNNDGSVWTLLDSLQTDPVSKVAYTPRLNIYSGVPYPNEWSEHFGRDQRQAGAVFRTQMQHVETKDLKPSYEKLLRSYGNDDDQHLTRFTQYLFPFVYLANDPLARHLTEVQASMSMAGTNPFYTTADKESASGSLASGLRHAAEHPNAGSAMMERGRGWNAHAVLAGLATSRNPRLQQLGRRWRRDFINLTSAVQLPTGGLLRIDEDKKASLDLNGDGRIGDEEKDLLIHHASSYMQGILRFAGGRALQFSLDPTTEADLSAKLQETLRKLDRYFVTIAWDASVNTPYWDMAVSLKRDPAKIFTSPMEGLGWGAGPDTAFYFDDILAAAYELSGDETYLTKFLAAMHQGRLGEIDPNGGNSIHAAWVLQRRGR